MDEHGNPIPGVLLVLVGMETRSSPVDTTTSTGAILIPGVRAGAYKLIARLDAFDAASATAVRDVVVTGDQTTALGDVTLVVARRHREADAPVISTAAATNSALPQTGEWSTAVDGVSGRLIVTPHMDGDGPQARIELALENRNSDDVFVFWWPLIYQLALRVHDRSGQPMQNVSLGGIPLVGPAPSWITIGSHSATTFTVRDRVLRHDRGTILVEPFGNQLWGIPADGGDIFLRGHFATFPPPLHAGHVWSGELDLPPVLVPKGQPSAPSPQPSPPAA